MKMQFDVGLGGSAHCVNASSGCRQKAVSTPRIGEVFPDFEAATTKGDIRFGDWATGRWTFVFSHPKAFTSVCTTEILSLAEAVPDFEERGAQILGITKSTVEEQKAWHSDISRTFGIPIDLRVAADVDGTLSCTLGALDPGDADRCAIRTSFILDPQRRVRICFQHPSNVGRSVEEVLRNLAALQTVDATGFATPADWTEGDPLINARRLSDTETEVSERYETHLTPYLSVARSSET